MTAPPPPPPPALTPWWFYTSPLPLDDPLSLLPITTSATSSVKHPPRPFSYSDTRALEAAYQSLLTPDATKSQASTQVDSCEDSNVATPKHLRHHRAVTEQQEYAEEGRGHEMLNAPIRPGSSGREDNIPTRAGISPTTERGGLGGLIIRGRTLGRSSTNLIRPDELIAKHLREDERLPSHTLVDNRQRRRLSSPEVNPWTGNPIQTRSSDYSSAGSSPSTPGIDPPPKVTTNPFIRSLSLSRRNNSRSPSPRYSGNGIQRRRSSPMSLSSSRGHSPQRDASPAPVKQMEIPVGIQRLHKVLLPSLTMAPIYWSPVHDVSGVCRGTWFYRDTMLCVETDMANRLERGYCEVRAWTEEWEAELESAVQVGKAGEEKVRWKLWDVGTTDATNTPVMGSRPGTSTGMGKSEPMDIGGVRRFEAGSKPNTPSARRGVFASYSSSWASVSPGSKIGTPPQSNLSTALSKTVEPIPTSVPSSLSSTRSFTEPFPENTSTLTNTAGTSASAIPNPNDWVIFANAKEAYICRDSMLRFGNRRPLATIRSAGTAGASNIGIRVIRGFDPVEWERLHPKRRITGIQKNAQAVETADPVVTEGTEKDSGAALAKDSGAETEKEVLDGRQEITDLILVIHGIGQKLSERVESFHFTHSINSFRRSMNMELRDPAVVPHLREPSKGMMVLPINWRTGLSFEEGRGTNPAKKRNNYTLENITLPTIPAVRNLIGDVMLDIPYYLSHTHKHKMIDAVVREANRVYGLWKMYNPGWEEKGGRVHLIAHSLGSAIALDVLSRQPTYIADWRREQEQIGKADAGVVSKKGCYGCSGRGRKDSYNPLHGEKWTSNATDHNFFDFDTANLYCAGSPAGFFLLLNHSMLLPRRGRRKPDAPPSFESDQNVFGEPGSYGCLAVDNIYNLMHYSDPICYRLNPTVDAKYADNLKIQPIPTATSTIFESIGSTIRSVLPGASISNPSSALPGDALLSPAAPNLARLPSTIELETHDFSREELAEKRMYMLNDNGTMDWYVGNSGGWVLENQYVNMLGAHSSYWESKDFIRFVVVESGRRPGRLGIRSDVQAVKVRGVR